MQGTLFCFLSVSESERLGARIGNRKPSTFEGFEFDSFVVRPSVIVVSSLLALL